MVRASGGCAALLLLATWASAPAAAETVVLRFATARYSATTADYFPPAAEDFEAATPGVEVKVEVLDPDRLESTLRSELADSGNPDMAVVSTRLLPELVRDGQLVPLDPLMSGEFRSRFIGSFLPPGRVAGKLYGLPTASSAYALFSNRDLLARGGVAQPPATWDALLADALRLKAVGVRALGLPGRDAGAATLWYCGLWSRGGELLDHDGHATFASAAGVASLLELRALAADGATEDAPDRHDAADVEAMFVRGEVAMALGTPALADRLARDAPALAYAVSAPPQATQPATYAVTDEMVLFSHSRVTSTAFHFMDYLFTRAPRLAFVKAERSLPTTDAVARDRYITKDERLRAFAKLLPAARFTPTVVGWDAAAAAVADAVHAVLAGQSAPEPALQAASARADAATGHPPHEE